LDIILKNPVLCCCEISLILDDYNIFLSWSYQLETDC